MAEPNVGQADPIVFDRLIYQSSPVVQDIVNRLSDLLNNINATPAEAVHELIVAARESLNESLTAPNNIERFNQLQEDNARLTAENADLGTQITNLTADQDANLELINNLTAERDMLRTLSLNLSSRPSESRLPDPEKFNGDKSKWRSFLTQLRLRASEISGEQKKMKYAINLLTGDAAIHVQRYVSNDRITLPTFARLVEILDSTFGDSNQRVTAEEGLFNLKQGSRNFVDYLTEFERYRADVDWEDHSLLYHLKHGLTYDLDRALLPYNPNSLSLEEFITTAKTVDNDLRMLKARHSHSKQSSSTSSRPSASRGPAPASALPPAPTAPSTATGTHPGPMDLSANNRRLSPAEKARRMKEGLCWYCGDATHIARNCPRKGPGSLRVNAASVSPADSTTLQIEESGNA